MNFIGPYFMIADISDPSKPTELGRVLLADAALDIMDYESLM